MKKLNRYLALAGLLTLTAGAGQAFANVAANTVITNQATLTYSGGQANASVNVTVALVPATPNVSITYGSSAWTAPNSPAITDTLTVTATANGPNSYLVTPSVGTTTNVSSSSPASVNISGGANTTISLGASVTTGTSAVNYVTVPTGTVAGGAVNGIGNGSTIVFTVNSHTYTITGVTVADNGNGTWKISWPDAQAINPADIPGPGVLVAEQKQVPIAVLPGTPASFGPATPIDVKVTATVHSNTGTNIPAVADASVTTASANQWTTPQLTVLFNKYVRNVTHSQYTGSNSYSTVVNGSTNTYYGAGVLGQPGDTLEYVVVAQNIGASDLTTSVVSDVIPTTYSSFLKAQYGGLDVFYVDPNGATAKFVAGAPGANQASYLAPNLTVNVGNGASAAASGTIPSGKQVTIAYQVTINP